MRHRTAGTAIKKEKGKQRMPMSTVVKGAPVASRIPPHENRAKLLPRVVPDEDPAELLRRVAPDENQAELLRRVVP